jgi:hypothetical protein
MINCKYCDSKFSNKYVLNHHQQNAKYCLEIQKNSSDKLDTIDAKNEDNTSPKKISTYKSNQHIQDICFTLYKRELDARKREHNEFLKLTDKEKEIVCAEQKFRDKIKQKEEKLISKNSQYKKLNSIK